MFIVGPKSDEAGRRVAPNEFSPAFQGRDRSRCRLRRRVSDAMEIIFAYFIPSLRDGYMHGAGFRPGLERPG